MPSQNHTHTLKEWRFGYCRDISCKLYEVFGNPSGSIHKWRLQLFTATFDEAAKLFHKLRDGGSPDHGSLPVIEYECLWPRRSCVKAGVFFRPNIFTLAQSSMEWPESLVCLDTVDLRSQACTDLWCSFSLVSSFPAVSSMYSTLKSLHLIL